MNTREQLLNGVISLPDQIIELVGHEYTEEMCAMFQALWTNYLKNKSSVSSVYWSDRFGNSKASKVAFNKFVMHLSRSGWITSIVEPKRNWAEIRFNESKLNKWLSVDEVLDVREHKKFVKYQMTDIADMRIDRVKTSKGIKSTGLVRKGFAKASANKFEYDTDVLVEYKDWIELNLTKSMRMLALEYNVFADSIDYESISKSILEHHIVSSDKEFCLGANVSDSRGRAIHQALGKVFNPISFKDARALLKIKPRPITAMHLPRIYMAIAELLGYKPNTKLDKIRLGKEAYANYTFNELDYSTEEGRKDMFENIWLERIYKGLDGDRNKWDVPVELDCTASMLQIEGILLDHKPFLDMTNVIGDELKDAWTFKDVPRNHFKKAMTPMLYGSSRSVRELWKNNKLQYTVDMVRKVERELKSGHMSVANKFKDFIVNNVQPKETMTVKIWNEEFDINCNRYRNVGDYTKRYDVFSSKEDRVVSIYHTHTHKEPDLDQFRRYFVTLLIHNLDSQIADKICQDVEWIIPIHDAFLVHPSEVDTVANSYTTMLNKMFADKDKILSQYFSSIGIDSKASVDWTELKSKCVPVNNVFEAQDTALK